jgi:hypothetical protein
MIDGSAHSRTTSLVMLAEDAAPSAKVLEDAVDVETLVEALAHLPDAVQPLSALAARLGLEPADLAADLAAWTQATGKADSDRVFAISASLFQILRRDLALAGIPYKDGQGRTIDVHEMMHTTATYLARANVSPRVAKEFMRHSSIDLTLETYTDPSLLDKAEALEALPELPIDGEPEDGRLGKGKELA